MSDPWDFDTDSKVLAGFVAGFLLIGVMGWKGCSESTREAVRRVEENTAVEQARSRVQMECLQAGHPALECKELR